MITAAHFEDAFQEYEKKVKNVVLEPSQKEDVKLMVKDVSAVLKQYGYDAGANIFEKIMIGEN